MNETNVGMILDVLKLAKEKYAELAEENKMNGNLAVADGFENDVIFLRQVIGHIECEWTVNTPMDLAVSNDSYLSSNIMDILTALKFVGNNYSYQINLLNSKYKCLNRCIEEVKNISLSC